MSRLTSYCMRLTQPLDEFVGTLIEDEATWKEYFKLSRRLYIALNLLEHGEEVFDWQKAHEHGILCESDYTDTFKEELKDCDDRWGFLSPKRESTPEEREKIRQARLKMLNGR